MSGTVKPFTVPDRAATYCRDIVSAMRGSDTGAHMDRNRDPPVESVVGQLRDRKEKYFAACLLDALIYRSAAQTRALMVQLFQRSLPDAMRDAKRSQRDNR